MFGTTFWADVSGQVARGWGDRLLSPALAFWASGVLAFGMARGWDYLLRVQALEVPVQLAIACAGLILVAGSATLVENLQRDVLRWLEGYWPQWLDALRRWRIKQYGKTLSRLRREWTNLVDRLESLAPNDRERFARLEAELRTYPDHRRLLPTRLGNLLRAAEDYPYRRYGLATALTWPRLWLTMPEPSRKEFTEAANRLNAAGRFLIWSTFFLVWSFWGWYWVVPLSFVGMIWGYWQALNAAGVYGELLRAAYDVHRYAIYEALRWPAPQGPSAEAEVGRRLTQYLWRGLADNSIIYVKGGK